MTIKTVCIFCGSSAGKDPSFTSLAKDLGQKCAQNDLQIVYGGAHVGLMGVVADSALAQGGKVIGVIPKHLQDREVAHNQLSDLHITSTMHERQNMMADLSDAFIILLGGLGTLAEFFEVLTWKALKLHEKPIYLLNTHAYWDNLLSMMDTAEENGFFHAAYKDLFKIVNDISDIDLFQKE